MRIFTGSKQFEVKIFELFCFPFPIRYLFCTSKFSVVGIFTSAIKFKAAISK
ncbi:hypothetical protein [Clostridium tyrobutyricum]|uniref:hypothetical protein n=1 Tax=Clostridium tyrobutyricum TaxID=1519 RepID=UPI0018E1F9AE|nr:hypothetical protein [Clostridium tyrobutyricum]